jgi:uncharacterized protein with ParB-like and HNH nuclease domain/predicted transport protein
MNAQDLPITQLLNGARQFIVPIFQRDYSWGTKHCQQLWEDIIRVGLDDTARGHFIGSVVYVAAEENNAAITRWLLIDGQQRLTTIILLLTALRDRMRESDYAVKDADDTLTPVELEDYYLINRHGRNERRYKLHLRRADQDTIAALLDARGIPSIPSNAIKENYEFLRDLVATADLRTVYAGIAKLVVVDVCLTRGQDDPQMIFESLNSTGLDLTQADLIRNFVLMRLDEGEQTELYENFWQPLELCFGQRYRTDFDKFIKDFLTLQLRPSTPLKSSETYRDFQRFYSESCRTSTVRDILKSLKRYGEYYAAFNMAQESEPALKLAFVRLRNLIEVASPVVMALYDCFSYKNTLNITEFVEAITLLESYVFRRSVCEMQTRSLGQIFSGLSYRIKPEQPLVSLKVALARQRKQRRFPDDSAFRIALESRDVYNMRTCAYLLERLENFDNREPTNTSNYSIEHVMPQNEQLRREWQEMLGIEWQRVHETWLHRLGNLTLTGYNSTYSDRSFQDKKSIAGGFSDSTLRLNRFIREQSDWTPQIMQARSEQLSLKALKIWSPLVVDINEIKRAELEDHRTQSANFNVENIEFDHTASNLYALLRAEITELGDGIVELPSRRSIAYRVYDFFVEVIPRANKLALVLNLDFADVDDPSGHAEDATKYAFITGANEKGGVVFLVNSISDMASAMHLVRQSYERACE